MPPPAPVFRPKLSLSPANQAAAVRTSPKATRVLWYQASADPSYDPMSGRIDSQGNRDQFQRTFIPGEHWAILDGEKALRRWFAQGSWEQGDITIGFMPAEMNVSIFDWIVPMGNGTAPPGLEDARTFTAKEVVVRGAYSTTALSGTISSTGTAITGVGTQFTTDFIPGDILTVGKQSFLVNDVDDDLHLVLQTPPVRDWAAISYTRSFDRTLYYPIARIESVFDGARTYDSSDFIISTDSGGVQWINPANCPAPGGRYSITYDYRPTYLITELGSKDVIVGGVPSLTVMMAKLLKPDTLKR